MALKDTIQKFIADAKELFSLLKQRSALGAQIAERQSELAALEAKIQDKQTIIDGIIADATTEAKSRLSGLEETIRNQQSVVDNIISKATRDAEARNAQTMAEIESNNSAIEKLQAEIDRLKAEEESITASVKKQENKLHRISNAYKSAATSIKLFEEWNPPHDFVLPEHFEDIEDLVPTVTLALHSDNIKDLRKQIRELNAAIDKTLAAYEKRYTTKANLAIYKLMVIALRAELQNILYSLKYGKIEDATDNVKTVTAKYLAIASEGNQSIAGTITKFIGEIEYLFIEVVKVEYEYYIRKERIKEEQKAIREQMRQEAEERKLLEQQRKQVEKEESKYQTEIQAAKEQLASADDAKRKALEAKVAELEAMLASVETKKSEIINLQNGQAGYVYIISNIGSFGEDVFKIGMTRRLDPMERIKELGDASVPFPFDVHGMIFSDNAATLETDLHRLFNDSRVNKVNARKEYFRVDMDTLEQAVLERDPAAEFTRTALAEQYRQTLSLEAAGLTHLEDEIDCDIDDE